MAERPKFDTSAESRSTHSVMVDLELDVSAASFEVSIATRSKTQSVLALEASTLCR
jgi:hypothetical protein